MQDLSNDMDDLFRKAVDRSPLRICDSRWDDLSTRIKSKNHRFLFIPIALRKIYLRMPVIFSILILIPAIVFSIMVMYKNTIRHKSIQPATSKTIFNLDSNNANKIFLQPHSLDFLSINRPKTISLRSKIQSIQAIAGNVISNNTFTQPSALNFTRKQFDGANKIGGIISETNDDHTCPFQIDNQLTFKNSFTAVQITSLQHIFPPLRPFYFGLVGGLMLSQVKGQPITKPGFYGGLVLGYVFNKRLSMETGIMRSKQYFVASGDYIQKISNIIGIKSLEGTRNAFSIPLTVKYNVTNGSAGSFFLTAGVSSFVGVEDHIIININSLPVPPTSKIDLGTTGYLPSYLSLGLGYEYKIRKFSNIRIEPYFEIPIHGNAGNSFKTHSSDPYMQVFNSGIHITVTQSAF